MSDFFTHARTKICQLVAHTVAIYLPVPPSLVSGCPDLVLLSLSAFNAGKRGLVSKWKMYLKWEERGDLLEIEESEKLLIARIQEG